MGSAALEPSASPPDLQLTDANTAGLEAGLAYYPTPEPVAGLTATFDALLQGGTGADGLTFALINAAAGTPILGGNGGGLGVGGNNGVAVALDTFQGLYNPSSNFVGLTTDSIGAGTMTLRCWTACSGRRRRTMCRASVGRPSTSWSPRRPPAST